MPFPADGEMKNAVTRRKLLLREIAVSPRAIRLIFY